MFNLRNDLKKVDSVKEKSLMREALSSFKNNKKTHTKDTKNHQGRYAGYYGHGPESKDLY